MSKPAAYDAIIIGWWMGWFCQLAIFVLTLWAAKHLGGLGRYVFYSWGVTQWIALVPLMWHQKAKGYPARVKGLLLVGCFGVLLSSTCAALGK